MPDQIVGLWRKVTRRCIQAVQERRGLCVVTIRVVVLNGDPLMWDRPAVRAFEPGAAGESVVAKLDASQLRQVGEWFGQDDELLTP